MPRGALKRAADASTYVAPTPPAVGVLLPMMPVGLPVGPGLLVAALLGVETVPDDPLLEGVLSTGAGLLEDPASTGVAGWVAVGSTVGLTAGPVPPEAAGVETGVDVAAGVEAAVAGVAAEDPLDPLAAGWVEPGAAAVVVPLPPPPPPQAASSEKRKADTALQVVEAMGHPSCDTHWLPTGFYSS